jgi:hypothetical protein
MNDEIDLIEQARKAGKDYVASLSGDLGAICADLRRRAREEDRQILHLPPQKPRETPVRKVS